MTSADVLFADKLLHQLEKKLKLKNRIGLEALIEEVEGHAERRRHRRVAPGGSNPWCSASATSRPRWASPTRDVGESDGYPGDIWRYARFRLVMACRAAGIDPVDGPYADFKNPEAYREECRRSMILGLRRRSAIQSLADRACAGDLLTEARGHRPRPQAREGLCRSRGQGPGRHQRRRHHGRRRLDPHPAQHGAEQGRPLRDVVGCTDRLTLRRPEGPSRRVGNRHRVCGPCFETHRCAMLLSMRSSL